MTRNFYPILDISLKKTLLPPILLTSQARKGSNKMDHPRYLIFFCSYKNNLLIFIIQNDEECDVVIQLALKLQDQQKEYKIITPYEAQRSLIESTMQQTEGMVWEDKCFNVDSFQGRDYYFCFNFANLLTIYFRQRGRLHYHFCCPIKDYWVFGQPEAHQCHAEQSKEGHVHCL